MGTVAATGVRARRRALPVAFACLVVAAGGTGLANARDVELVVDCSVGMLTALEDHVPGLVASRVAIAQLAATLAATPVPRIGVRLMGSRQPLTAEAACQDTVLAEADDRRALAGALDEVTPRGRRPLVAAVVAAASDLAAAHGERRIVLVTSGTDDCGGDRAAAARALAAGVELRVVGVALDQAALASFTAVAPTHNVTSTAELAAALQSAVLSDGEPAARADLTVRVLRDGGAARDAVVTARAAATGEAYVLTPTEDGSRAELPAGPYDLSVATADGVPLSGREGLTLAAGAAVAVTVDLEGSAGATLQLEDGPLVAGGWLGARFDDAGEGRHRIEITPSGAPADAWTARATVEGSSGTVRLPLPVEPPTLELRLARELADGLLEPLAVLPLETTQPAVELVAAASVPPRDPLQVTLKGPVGPEDWIVIATAGAGPLEHLAAAPVPDGDPVALPAPATEGTYELRCVSGASGRILARRVLAVAKVQVSLQVPATVEAGREFTVVITPPPAPDGHLSLVRPDASPGDYLLWAPAAERVPMTAPREPGRYEVRYLAGLAGEMAARAPLEVAAVPARLEVPARVSAGHRFQVVWTGPDAPGDFIAIAPPGSPRRRHLDWAYTSQGSPADLAAPFDPGTYEVRYMSGESLKVLASRPLVVD